MTRIVEWMAAHRVWAVSIALLIAVGFGFFTTQLSIDNSLEAWFVEDDPALLSYQQFLKVFGNDEVVVTAIQGSGTVFDSDRLNQLFDLTQTLEAIDGVERVWSLASLTLPVLDSNGLSSTSILTSPVSDEQAQQIEQIVQQSQMASRLVGVNDDTLVIYTWFVKTPDLDARRGALLAQVQEAVSASLSSDEQAYHGGFGVVYEALNQATLGEGGLFIGLSYLIIAVAIFFVTGRWLWTVLALVTVTLADTVMFGAMGLLGRSINTVTIALPALVMILGVANVLHLTTHVESSGRRRLPLALSIVAVPCVLNALTTSGGFLSLTSASMAITRDYGMFAATGVLAAVGFALVGTSVLLPYAKQTSPSKLKKSLSNWVEHIVAWSLSHRTAMLIAGAGVILLSIFGITQIEADTDTIGFLPASSAAHIDNQKLEELIGPYTPMEVLITVEESQAWKDEGFLNALSAADEKLKAHPKIGDSTSVANLIHDFEAVLPQAGISNILNQLDLDDDALKFLISDDGRTLRLTATVSLATAKTLAEVGQDIETIVRDEVGAFASVEASGYLPLYSRIVERLLQDQLTSFAWAFAVVFLLVAIVLRDWRLTLLAIPTNLLPVAIVLGTMGFLGIHLDIATVTIAAAVLGIVVDDTLHMLYGLKRQLREGASLADAFAQVSRTSGVAIVSTTVVFALGFGVIGLASVKSVAYVGLLTAIAVSSALIVDLILLPALATLMIRAKN
jgi:hypothetical protein